MFIFLFVPLQFEKPNKTHETTQPHITQHFYIITHSRLNGQRTKQLQANYLQRLHQWRHDKMGIGNCGCVGSKGMISARNI